jgi:hypothetical protein
MVRNPEKRRGNWSQDEQINEKENYLILAINKGG